MVPAKAGWDIMCLEGVGVIKVSKENEGYFAHYSLLNDGDSVHSLGPNSESDIKQQLYSLGFVQRDIEEAFTRSDKTYFGVGKC
jgi:hypothetical protein